MKDEILVARKEKDKMKFKVCHKEFNNWSPPKYEKIVVGKDYNILAYLLFDLYSMGYNIPKAYWKFKSLLNEPELFFLQ